MKGLFQCPHKPEDVMAIVAVVEDRKKDMRFRKRTG